MTRSVFPFMIIPAILVILSSPVRSRGHDISDQVFIVGGDMEYPPYEYLDKEGRPRGLNVDIAHAISEELGLNLVIKLEPWGNIREKLKNGIIDAVGGLFYSEQRDAEFDFAQSHATIHHVAVVPHNKKLPSSLEALRGKKIVVMKGDIMHDYALDHNLQEHLITAATQEKALEMVVDGTAECALVAELPGLYWTKKNKWQNSLKFGKSLYSLDYSFAVPEGRRELLKEIREGLAILQQNGELNRLYKKHLGVLKDESWTSVLADYIGFIFSVITVIFLAIILWTMSLRKTVEIRTKEIEVAQLNFKLLAENITDVFWITTPDFKKRLYVSPAFEKVWGKPVASVYGDVRVWTNAIHPDDRGRIEKMLLDQGAAFSGEYRIIQPNGAIRWIKDKAFPVYDTEERLVKITGLAQDITEKKQAEDARQEAMSLLSDAEGIGGLGSWEWRADTQELRWSDELYRLFGYAPGEIHPDKEFWFKSIVSDDESAVRQFMESIQRGAAEVSAEYRIQKKDGSIRDFFVKGSRKLDVDGKSICIIGIVQDITERKILEAELREREERFRAIFNYATDGILVTDVETKEQMMANDVICSMLGYTKDELLQKKVYDLHAPEDIPVVMETFERQARGDFQRAENIPVLRKDGSVFYADINTSPVSLYGRKYVVGIFRDNTERKKIEDELHATLNELNVIQENAPVAILLVDADRRVIKANSAAAMFAGKSVEKMKGMRGGEALGCLNHLDDPNGCGFGPSCEVCEVRRTVVETLESGRGKEGVEAWLPFANAGINRKTCLLISTAPVNLGTNKAVLLCALDITGRKNAEQELKQYKSELEEIVAQRTEQLRTQRDRTQYYLDIAGVTIMALDASGVIKLINREGYRLLGYEPGELEGKNWFDTCLLSDNMSEVKSVFHKIVAGETEPVEFHENPVRTKSGEERKMLWHNTIIRDEQEKEVLVLSSGTDVTDIKKAQDSIQNANKQLTFINDLMNESIRKSHTNEILENALDRIISADKLSLAEKGRIFWKSDTDESFQVLCEIGFDPHERHTAICENFYECFCSQTVREKRFVSETQIHKCCQDTNESNGKYCVPVFINDQVEGILCLYLKADQEPKENELNFLETTANTIASIVERKKIEALVAENEYRFRTVADYTYDWEYWRLPNNRFAYVSPSVKRITGYEPQEFIDNQHLFIQIVHPEDQPAFLAHVHEAGTRDVDDLHFRVLHKNGTTRWIQHVCHAMRDDNNNYLGVRASNRDITVQVILEKEKSESQEMFRQMAENIQEIFFLVDIEQKKMLYISKAAESIVGLKLADLVYKDRDILSLVHEEDRERLRLDEVLHDAGISIDEELRIRRPDGGVRWLRIRTFPIRDTSKTIVRVAGVATDITVHKIAAERERLHIEQLQQADKMASLGLLVSGVAHEINNPNNFVMLNTPLLREVWDNAKPILEIYNKQENSLELAGIPFLTMVDRVPRLFDGILDGAHRIKTIVEDLKNYARKDESQYNNSVDLSQVVREAVSLLKIAIKKATKNFSVHPVSDVVTVRGNKQKLEQVIINLIQNACDALRSTDDSIEVRLSVSEQNVTVSVIDTGCGIPESNLAHLTDPFFTTRRQTGGTGLGLSVSAGIITEHKGTLRFFSEVDKGTTAQITLPLYFESVMET